MNTVNEFQGEYRFLSNFWPCRIEFRGRTFQSAEHVYQCAKAVTPQDFVLIRNATTPGQAKRLARRIQLRPNWNELRVGFMFEIVQAKFSQNPELARRLVDTCPARLVEGNTWGDTFWGECRGKGENNLGQILMNVRCSVCTLQCEARK